MEMFLFHTVDTIIRIIQKVIYIYILKNACLTIPHCGLITKFILRKKFVVIPHCGQTDYVNLLTTQVHGLCREENASTHTHSTHRKYTLPTLNIYLNQYKARVLAIYK